MSEVDFYKKSFYHCFGKILVWTANPVQITESTFKHCGECPLSSDCWKLLSYLHFQSSFLYMDYVNDFRILRRVNSTPCFWNDSINATTGTTEESCPSSHGEQHSLHVDRLARLKFTGRAEVDAWYWHYRYDIAICSRKTSWCLPTARLLFGEGKYSSCHGNTQHV